MKHAQILVVGAGLGGLALARVLGQAGLAPR
jgi:cation diffusion facilitator CzcD-associated flavoprotein CzcO